MPMSCVRAIPYLLLIALSAFLSPPDIWAQLEVGGYAGAPFRRADLPQEAAMGGAYVPLSPDASAVFINSAFLAGLQRRSAMAAATKLPFGQTTQLASVAFAPYEGIGIGVGVSRYGVDAAEGRTLLGQKTGPISSNDLAFSLGGGLAIGPGSVGATIRYLRRDVTGFEVSENGYAVDLSGTLILDDRYYLSIALNNVAGGMVATYDEGPRDIIPWSTRLGLAYLHALEEPEEEIRRPDPSGTPIRRRLLPKTYVLGTVDARISEYDTAAIVGLAVEAVPERSVDLGFRVGGSIRMVGETLREFAIGFFYRFDIFRLDMSTRWGNPFGDVTDNTYHAMITVDL